GLGSIEITPKLYAIDRKKRYEKLFESDDWREAKEERESNEFIKAFEGYILNHLSNSDKNDVDTLWDTPRLKELKALLNWQKGDQPDWLSKTRYMEITPQNEFEDRLVLPKPTGL
ncbi:MAG: TIGR03986 family CRISPR-associated RAMP protein, partial [Thermotoga sp.]